MNQGSFNLGHVFESITFLGRSSIISNHTEEAIPTSRFYIPRKDVRRGDIILT